MTDFIKKLQEYNNSSTAKLLRPIVPIEEWVNSPYYASPDIETLYPFWKKHMINIFNSEIPINEVILHGCQNKETRIPTSLGYLSYEELYTLFNKENKEFDVLSEEGLRKCIGVYDTGINKTYRVTFSDGSIVEGTKEHRVRYINGKFIDWKYYDQMMPGDKVLKSRLNSWCISNKSYGDLPYVLGFWLGDGTYDNSKYGVRFCLGESSLDTECHKVLLEYANKHAIGKVNEYYGINKQYGESRYCQINFSDKDFIALVGKNKHFNTKILPDIVYAFNLYDIGQLLSGLIDSDGCIELCNNSYSISLSMGSERLMRDLKNILDSMGIKSDLSIQKAKGSRKGHSDLYRLRITDTGSICKLRSILDLKIDYKKKRLENVAVSRGLGIKEVRDIMYTIAKSHTTSMTVKNSQLNNKYLSDVKFKKLYELHNLQGINRTLDYCYNLDTYEVEVVSVEETECHTMDIEVEGSPTYLFNGFISHNSLGGGKCFKAGTRVMTEKGYIPVEKLYENPKEGFNDFRIKVWSRDGWVQTSHFYKHSNCVVNNVVLDNNYEINGTNEHRILTLVDDKIDWKRMDELVEGDIVLLNSEPIQLRGNNYSVDDYYFLGAWLGDGWYTGDNEYGFMGERSFVEKFKYWSKFRGKIVEVNNSGLCSIRNLKSDTIPEVLKSQKGLHSDTKFIPQFVFESSIEQRVAFVSGLLDTDGSFYSRGFDIVLNNKRFIDELYEVFSTLGLVGRKTKKIVNHKNYYRLKISMSEFHQSKLEFGRMKNTVRSNISKNSRVLLEYNDKFRIRLLRSKIGHTSNKSITKLKLLQYKKDCVLPGDLEYLVHCTYHKVKSVYKTVEDVYDLTVPSNHEFYAQGCINHNTTFACFLALRKIYELSCYDIPQKLFNLQVSSVISAVLFSVNKEVAESGIYGQLRALIDTTPYFQQVFPRDKNLKYDIIWSDKRMRVGYGSNANDQIGQNMYFSVLDEGNFFQGEGNMSSKTSTSMSKSQSLYLSIRRRGENRFSSGGVDYSLSVLISSARTSNSMVEKRIEATRGNPHVYVIHAVSYEITPEKYSKDKFWCFIGNDLLDPMVVNSVQDLHNILDSMQEPWPEFEDLTEAISLLSERSKMLFTQVPMNLKQSYESDIISALQDLSGISVSPMGRLFTSRKHFNECIDPSLQHPFIQDEFVISTGSEVQVSSYLKSDWRPKDIDKPRFIHIDQSTTTDSTGISMCYIDRVDHGLNGEILPHITVDFMLRINLPLAPNHIDIAKCRAFIIYLKNNLGVRIGKCTYDSFQSAESRQQLEMAGIPTDLLSVDRTATEYKQFCDLIYANRISFYRYPRMEKELFELIYFRDQNKVDHPPVQQGGTKDVMDSLVGAVTNALNSDEITNIQRAGDIDILLNIL